MRVLFISSGNHFSGITPIVHNQQNSLIRKGIQIDNFLIKGNGVKGYLKNSYLIFLQIRKKSYDIIHAHYSVSAFAATLAGCKPLVVSLMGSDTHVNTAVRALIRLFSRWFWAACIVKTDEMKKNINLPAAYVIPNGVNINQFRYISKSEAQAKLGFDRNKKYILFPANPARPEKNFTLAQAAINLVKEHKVIIHFLHNIPNEEAVWHYCACDLVLLTSKREGSPNVIKEAMACSRPIVCTNVGDVELIIGSTEECYICEPDAKEIAVRVQYILDKGIIKTNGHENIQKLRDDLIADKIITVYESVIGS